MATQKYSSYAQIDRELEILKIERELNLQKLYLGFQDVKENLEPKNLVKGLVGSYMPSLPGPYGKLLNLAFPIITRWVFKKIRGR